MKLARLLHLPWTWLVFIPFLGIWTLLAGSLAWLVSRFDRNAAFVVGCAWARVMCWINFTRVTVRGRENLRPGQSCVIMSNHQSHFDVLALHGHLRKQFRWVIKKELRSVPVLGAACASTGHVFVDRANRAAAIASLKAAAPLLAGGVSALFFPEGTRSRDGRMKEFKKGGFMMALDLGLPILPVSVSGTGRILPGKSLRLLPGRATVTIHPPIDASAYGEDGRDRLMADVRAAIGSGLTAWERGV